MADIRSAILRGTRAAAKLHRELGVKATIKERGGRVDVFDAIVRCGVPFLFRPLKTLLGVFLPEPMAGILVTTQRPLSVQRFTGAHELGHYLLHHQPSLDDESLLRRSPFSDHVDYGGQEREADAFAAEFLIPRWLLASHFQRQGWSADRMHDPHMVYQLSLRIGASYEATCRTLLRHKLIDRPVFDSLLSIRPKSIKQALLQGYKPEHGWGDVWLLTERDEGSVIEGSRSDIFILRLREHSGAGYLWTFEQLNKTGFAIVRDECDSINPDAFGGEVTRLITAVSTLQHRLFWFSSSASACSPSSSTGSCRG